MSSSQSSSSSNTSTRTSYFDPKTKQILCTQTAGFISTFTFYPIDTVRTRTMSHDNTSSRLHHNNSIRYRGILRPISLVVEHEGVGALYRGASVAVGGATASWGIYMFLYRNFQELLQQYSGWEPNFVTDCMTSTVASVGNAYLTTPVWHVKTRMQLEDTTTTTSSSSTQQKRRYRGFFKSLIAVYNSDGFFGLWRGFSPQLLMSVVNGVYFPVYQQVLQNVRLISNSYWWKHDHTHSDGISSIVSYNNKNKTTENDNTNNNEKTKKPSTKPTNWEVAIASAGAKTLINLFSNPLFVVRTRLQDERHSHHDHVRYQSLMQSVKVIFKQEGVLGFYKGLRAGLLITAPKSVMTMVVAENLYHQF